MDVLSNSDENATTEMWYRLLNCGFRVPISAGTDSFTNVADHYIAGGGRVYVLAGPRFDYAAWLDAFRRGTLVRVKWSRGQPESGRQTARRRDPSSALPGRSPSKRVSPRKSRWIAWS